MRMLLAACFLAMSCNTAAAFSGTRGNDTGGIIVWSPDNERSMHYIAASNCARYGKRAVITSVWRRYGQYIGYVCKFDGPRQPSWGPRLMVRF